jgi:hypothetical protein
MMGIMGVMVLGALLFTAIASVDADAAKGGANAATSGPTLTVTPNQVPLGSTSINISGSGFRANQGLQVGVQGGIPTHYVVTDGNGSFSITHSPGVPNSGASFDTAGPYTALAAKSKGRTLVTLATAPFTVCPTNPCQ